MEFPDLRKRYWGRHFWARGYFSTTSGNITDTSVSSEAAGIAVDVISLFMALLSSHGISTPSLQAQGEQRRSSYFNNHRDIAFPPDVIRRAVWVAALRALRWRGGGRFR